MVHPSFDIGVHYILRGQYERALRAFEEVVRTDPSDARAWSYLGVAYAHVGNAHEAERSLAKATELSPENAEAWFHLGVARSMQSEWPEAASAYRHAVAFAPDDLVAWHRLGVALAESGDEPAASVAFERALVLSRETGEPPLEEPIGPLTPDTHLAEKGEKESGREAKSWIDLALSLLSLGEEEEAIAAYERAYRLDPDRATGSLFRPMLRLFSASASAPSSSPVGPSPPVRKEPRPTAPEDRPETP